MEKNGPSIYIKLLCSPFILILYLCSLIILFLVMEPSIKPRVKVGSTTHSVPNDFVASRFRDLSPVVGTEAVTCNCDCQSYCSQISGANNISTDMSSRSGYHSQGKPSTRKKFGVPEAIAEVQKFAKTHHLENITNANGTNLVFIITAWRSGSSFFGEALSSHPAINYHFEPLMYFELKEVSTPEGEELQTAVHTLESLANCNFMKADKFMTKITNGWNLILRNTKVNSQCLKLKRECLNFQFLQETCRLFPIQLFKVTRLRGKAVEELMKRFPTAKIIYLVRDPRATYSSRMQVSWCPLNTPCGDIKLLCDDLQKDLEEIKALQARHTTNVQVIKYEHIALAPEENLRLIYTKFLGLDWDPDVKKYLDQHTRSNKKDPMSTVKLSSAHVDQWKHYLGRETVLKIETECQRFITDLGYNFTSNT